MSTPQENYDAAVAALLASLDKPTAIKSDAGEVAFPWLANRIEAAEYFQKQTTGSTRTMGVRFRKLVPPGAD